MAERAALRIWCDRTRSPELRGTRVLARLPLMAEEEE
jgi:hypothetical protein